MSIRKKTMLMLFVDYLLCLLIQLFGLFVLSWILKYNWGYPVYSIVFCLIFFGMQYSRVHNAADRALKRKELKSVYEGLIMSLPLAICNFVVILIFALMQWNIIPAREVIVTTLYSFPDDAPRVVTHMYLLDYVTSGIRVWFGHLVGFLKTETPAVFLLISPAITLLAGFLGYTAGRKKFYLSDLIYNVQEKAKEKFNE